MPFLFQVKQHLEVGEKDGEMEGDKREREREKIKKIGDVKFSCYF